MGGTGSANPVSMPHLLVKAGRSFACPVSIPQRLVLEGRTSAIAIINFCKVQQAPVKSSRGRSYHLAKARDSW